MKILPLATLLLSVMTALAESNEPAPKKEPATQPKNAAPPEDVDVAKTTERIIQDANAAGKLLGDKNPGRDTQRIQSEILKNIDSLLRKAKQRPPMSDDSSSSPNQSGGMDGGTPKQKSGGGEKTPNTSMSRQERREKNRNKEGSGGERNSSSNSQPLKTDPEKSSVGSNDRPNQMDPKGAMPRIPDAYKDVWGHLPEKMRQEMDLYFREQFMPRYSELLRQYYTSLSERQANAPKSP